jgi:hypothetical protein
MLKRHGPQPNRQYHSRNHRRRLQLNYTFYLVQQTLDTIAKPGRLAGCAPASPQHHSSPGKDAFALPGMKPLRAPHAPQLDATMCCLAHQLADRNLQYSSMGQIL